MFPNQSARKIKSLIWKYNKIVPPQYKSRFDVSHDEKIKKAKLKSQKNEKTSSNTALPHIPPQKPTHKSPTRRYVVSAPVGGNTMEEK